MPRCYDDADAATKLQITGFREGGSPERDGGEEEGGEEGEEGLVLEYSSSWIKY